MAKRFHEGKQGLYEGMDERRKQEREDGSIFGMSQSGYFANMPTEVIFKAVGRPYSEMNENLDDTMHGVNKQIDMDITKLDKHLHPKKV